MSIVNKLSLNSKKNVPVILQSEASECGLACLAMIFNYYGYFKLVLFKEYTNESFHNRAARHI